MKFALFALALVLAFTSTLAQPSSISSTVCPKYTVKTGDSLAAIASSFGILPSDLDAALSFCGQSAALLQIGQEICLPGSDKAGCVNVVAFDQKPECKAYIVQLGDTITSVAGSLDLFANTLGELNNDVVAGGVLQPGKYLKLPSWPQSCGDPNKSGEECRVYIVQEGDFISGIATAFSVSVDDLLTVNQELTAGATTVLQKNQPIKIPPFPASCGAGIPTKPPTNTVIKCRGYQAQQNDDLATIAAAFKTTVSDLSNLNPELATAGIVKPGDIVKVPPYDSTCPVDPVLVPLPTSNTPPAPALPPAPVVPSPPPAPLSPSPPPVVPSPPSPVPSPPVVTASPPAVAPTPAEPPSPPPAEEGSPPPTVVVASTPPPPASGAVSRTGVVAAVAAALAAVAAF